MTSPRPPKPANRRSGLLDLDEAIAAFVRYAGGDIPPMEHLASCTSSTRCYPDCFGWRMVVGVEHLRALLDEAQRAGLNWRRHSETQDERIDRLRRAVADLRARIATIIDGHVPETCAYPGRTVCFECGSDWPCATITAAGGSPDSWPSHDR